MFQLDQQAAMSVNGGGNRVNESGIYLGEITRAEWSQSQSSQAAFLNIDFKTDSGQEANYMSVCYQKGDGTRAFGYNTMMAMIACCRLNGVTQAQTGGKLVCPEFIGKRLMLGLQAEADWFQDKETGEYKPTTNMNIFIPFTHEGLTAKELLEKKTQAETINKIVIQDRKPKPKPEPTIAQREQNGMPQYDQVPVDQYNDAPF